MKKTMITTTLLAILICACIMFSFTGCDGFSLDIIENAVNEATAPLNEQITALEADIAGKEAKITALEGEKAELADEIAELEESITKKDTEITNRDSSVKSLTEENQALTDRVTELESENAALRNCLEGIHTYTYTDDGDGLHSGKCICGDTTAKSTHVFNDENKCTCGLEPTVVTTAEELIAALEIGGFIQLGDNITYAVPNTDAEYTNRPFSVDAAVIMDLNGYSLTNETGHGLVVNEGGVLTLYGGYFSDEEGAVSSTAVGEDVYCGIVCLGTLKIVGGTFEGGRYALWVEGSDANATVYGTFNSSVGTTSDGTLTVTGGTFVQDPSAFVDTETYTVTDNEDGTWTVSAKVSEPASNEPPKEEEKKEEEEEEDDFGGFGDLF